MTRLLEALALSRRPRGGIDWGPAGSDTHDAGLVQDVLCAFEHIHELPKSRIGTSWREDERRDADRQRVYAAVVASLAEAATLRLVRRSTVRDLTERVRQALSPGGGPRRDEA